MMPATYLVNGQPGHSIDITDRGLHYGDGLFETLPVVSNRPLHIERHLARLRRGAERLSFPELDVEQVHKEVCQLARACSLQRGIIKILLTRGSGGRGYRVPDPVNCTRIVGLHPYPEYDESLWRDGINLCICKNRLGYNPALAGIKHLNRLEQVLARNEWTDTSITEGLMKDMDGNIVEGTSTNVFICKNKSLRTPLINKCGIQGIMRELVLLNAGSWGYEADETTISCQDLHNADAIFVTNSVIGMWPVKQLESTPRSLLPEHFELVSKARKLADG